MCKRVLAMLLCAAVIATAFCPRLSAKGQEISAKAYVLMEASTGKVLKEQSAAVQLPMASTTKIMTALLALGEPEIDKRFVVDSNAIRVEGSSMGLKEGDSVSLYTLAVGMLLASGNDAAGAAAVRISGTSEAFAKRMNSYAKKLHMDHTNFVTPSGLNDAQHYSTAFDMALLAREAIKNPRFLAICSQSEMTISYGNPPYKRSLQNHNRLLKEYDGCIGLKTGFTKAAGRCLVSAAQRGGVTLICVTLDAPNDWADHKALFDYGFSQVACESVSDEPLSVKLQAVGGNKNCFFAQEYNTAQSVISGNEKKKLQKRIVAQRFFYAPIKKGEIVGEVQYSFNGEIVACTKLISAEAVAQTTKVKEKSLFEQIADFFNI